MKKKLWARRPVYNLKIIFTVCSIVSLLIFINCLGTEFTLIKFLVLLSFFIPALCSFWVIKVGKG